MKTIQELKPFTAQQLVMAGDIMDMVMEKAQKCGLMEEHLFIGTVGMIVDEWCEQTGRKTADELQKLWTKYADIED